MIWLVLPAFGADMEGLRLAGELESMVQERKWVGVEKVYRKLVMAHPQSVVPAYHLAGAEAARSRGELLLAAQRLGRVPDSDEQAEQARAELDLLEHQTGYVLIDRSGTLMSEGTVFNPALRAAEQFAADRVAEDGGFVGLLPSGAYTLDGVRFTVRAGFEPQHVVIGAASESEAGPDEAG